MKGLPREFFTKPRPNIRDIKIQSKNPDDEIIPFMWSKDVLEGKYRNKVIITMPNQKKV